MEGFSIGNIARLIADDGGLSEKALRNKNAEDYRALISQWVKYSLKLLLKKLKKKRYQH